MAKRRYRRNRRRSGRWAPNIVKISSTVPTTPGEWYYTEELAKNPVQITSGVSQTFTAKNFEISFTMEEQGPNTANSIEGVTAFIMFVPQGMNITSGYYAEHPEYILAMKYLGSPMGGTYYYSSQLNAGVGNELQQFQPIKVRTRLARKLQTGDSIVLFLQGSSNSSINANIVLNGIVRWWSKAN